MAHHGAAGMYMTLPQPCWSVTGATEWIMSQCHQTESPGCTSGIGVSASSSNGCQRSVTGKAWLSATPHMLSAGTSSSSGRSIR